MQHARPIGPTTNTAATFQSSMTQGSGPPPRSPIRAAWKPPPLTAGWQVSQPTHVAATFAPAMSQGSHPDQNRAFIAPRAGRTWWTPEVDAFSVEMATGWRPSSPRLFLAPRIPLPVSQTTQTDAAFGPEMAQGSVPPQSRAYVAPKSGWSVSQTSHVEAPILADMFRGVYSDAQLPFRPHFGAVATPPDVDAFSIEMVQGWHADQPRIRLASRIPLPVSQTTHVAATFSPEMSAGLASVSHLPFEAHVGTIASTPDVFAFSVEMVQGSHPDQARLFSTRRLWPVQTVGQITPITLFSVEMANGVRSVARFAFKPHVGQVSISPDIAAFSVDMVIGSHPDRPRLFLAPWLQQPVSQTLTILNPVVFSSEMVIGVRPLRRSQVERAARTSTYVTFEGSLLIAPIVARVFEFVGAQDVFLVFTGRDRSTP